MLNKITIKNYKCFPSQGFAMAPLTLLAGANGAGKSSLIQTILLLKEAIEDGRAEVTITPQKVFGGNIGKVAQLVSQDFHGDRQAGAPAKRRGDRVRSPLPGERAQSRSTEKR